VGTHRRWLRPAPSALFLFGLVDLLNLFLGYFSSSAVDEFGWWMPALALASTVFGVQASGAAVRLEADELVIRGGVTERHVPRSRVVGLWFVTTLNVMVRGGRTYTTNLVQTSFRPSAERLADLGRRLAREDEEPLPVITAEDRRNMGGPSSPDFDPEVLHHERPQLYWPEWWQFVLYGAFVASCVLGALQG